jgi:MFS family permease
MQTPGQPRFSRRSKLANFFGLKRNLVILLLAIFVIGAGEELWMRFVPKYLQAVGATVFVIGLYDALRTLLGAIYAYPGGVIADRWGHRHAFVIFNVVSIVGYVLVFRGAVFLCRQRFRLSARRSKQTAIPWV